LILNGLKKTEPEEDRIFKTGGFNPFSDRRWQSDF
jgi:hypothetical protein